MTLSREALEHDLLVEFLAKRLDHFQDLVMTRGARLPVTDCWWIAVTLLQALQEMELRWRTR